MKMPLKYVNEMIMDRIAASKIYEGKSYTQHSPLEYYEKGKDSYMIHPETRALLEYMLHMLDEKGEEFTFAYMRKYMVCLLYTSYNWVKYRLPKKEDKEDIAHGC